MYEELHRFDVTYGVIMNGHERENIPTVQVASIHTLRSRYFENHDQLPPADLILIDEAHKELEAYARLFKYYPNAKILGLTATPAGPQGKTLVPDLYEVMVEGCRNTELIGDGLLLPTRVIAPSEPSIEGVTINGGKEFNQQRLSKRVSSVTAFGDVFKEWEPYSDRQTIVFAPGVAYCRGLAGGFGEGSDSFWSRGVEAAVIHAGTKQKQRDEILDRFCSGSLKVLLSVDVLREGFDAPIASCAIDLQPNSQLRTYWQKVGRIKRAYEGQSEAVYVDMAGNIWRHIHPDDDPDWDALTGEKTTAEIVESAKGKKPTQARCGKCGEVRGGGDKCRSCGHESKPSESVRKVRMGNGKLKEVPLVEKKKAELTDRQRVANKWKSELFIGLKANRTLLQCKFHYQKRHGDWPPNGLPAMPAHNSVDWKRKVGDVYSPEKIMEMFRRDGE
jgi:DNA repair protein RadD